MRLAKANKLSCLILALGFMGCGSLNRAPTVDDFQCYPQLVYLFRHAEKKIIKGEKDLELTRAGFARADQLAEDLKDIQNGIIFSSEYKRTQQTVNPLASAWNTNVKIHTANDPRGQVNRALSYCKKTVLISGHSNTVPNLIRLFGVIDEITISDNQYGDLFQIQWLEGKPNLTITQVGK